VCDHVTRDQTEGHGGHGRVGEVGHTVGSRTGRGADVAGGDLDMGGIPHAQVSIDAAQAGSRSGYDERADDGTPVHQTYDDMAGAGAHQRVQSIPGQLAAAEHHHDVGIAPPRQEGHAPGAEQLTQVGEPGAV